ncbi:MAG: lactonase family protein [Cyclobacteriaceae bacterium]
MMKKLLLLLFTATVFFACQKEAPKESSYFVYVASGDSKDGSGIGIYNWVPSKGELSEIVRDSAVVSSGYLAMDSTKEVLYSINGEKISAFKVDTKSGFISLINEVPQVGKGACHVSVSNDGQFLIVGYYSSGSLATFGLNENGSIGELKSQHQHTGSSINTSRQESSHVHQVLPVPNSNLILVPDLGIDKVMVYAIDEAGDLTLAPDQYNGYIKPGGGPRHAVVHPNGKYAYVLHELTGYVTGFQIDSKNGLKDTINTVSTLPDGFNDFNKSADIHITPNGKYLYASNRGHNSLAVCKIIPETGALVFAGTKSCGGDWPRAFGIDPSGDFILVANKNDNQISILKIDYSTGFFEKVGEVQTPLAPQGIRFIKSR